MQTTPHIRPMSIGDVLDAAFRLFRERFTALVGIAALIQIPWTILQLAVQLPFLDTVLGFTSVTPLPGQDPLAAIPWADLALLSALLTVLGLVQIFLLTNIVGGAVVASAAAYGEGRPLGILGAYREGARSLGSLILATLLTSLGAAVMVGGLLACAAGLGVAALGALPLGLDPLQASLAGSALALLGMLLAIPLALYFAARLFLLVPAVVAERLGPLAGLRRTWQLTRPGFWRALLLLVLVLAITIIISLLTTLATQAISLAGELVLDEGALLALSTVVSSLLGALGTTVVQPLQFLVQLFLYYDLRVRYEGYDLELRAQRLAASR